jgi:hypothetical protein
MAENPYQHAWGFRSACESSSSPSASNVTTSSPHAYPLPGYSSSGYLTDPVFAYSPCNNPALLLKHGIFASFKPGTWPLYPMFSMSSSVVHGDILGVGYPHDSSAKVVPWEEKTKSKGKVVCRRSGTGGYYSTFGECRTVLAVGTDRDGSRRPRYAERFAAICIFCVREAILHMSHRH